MTESDHNSTISDPLPANPGKEAPTAGERPARWALLFPTVFFILARSPFLLNDPSDFPMDRNVATAYRIERLREKVPLNPLAWDQGHNPLEAVSFMPEFPFVALSGWVGAGCGLPPLIAARSFALLCGLLTGLGLYFLGRRTWSPAVGLMAFTLYAVLPFSVFLGRSLLSESPMVTAVVWSMVAAGLGSNRAGPISLLTITACLIVAGLAKLPALLFAPAAAIAFLGAAGWRRPVNWIGLLICAFATYAAVCWWYGLAFLSPVAGLRRMSADTNNLLTFGGHYDGIETFRIVVSRGVLALTLPGFLIAAGGWILLQQQSGRRLPLNLWFLLAIAYVWLSTGANTYWACVLAPIGCLLMALAIVEVGRRNRVGLIPLLLIAGLALAVCPGTVQVVRYLKTEPLYEDTATAVRNKIRRGAVCYHGNVPQDLEYYVGVPGESFGGEAIQSARDSIFAGRYRTLLSIHPEFHGVILELFNEKPILASRPWDYVLFDTRRHAALGQPLRQLPSPMLNHDLDGVMRIVDLAIRPEEVGPGERLTVEVTYQKGPNYQSPPALSVLFVHQAHRAAIPLSAVAGGTSLDRWPVPLIQAPNFTRGDIVKMRHQFEISPQMPAGDYQLKFFIFDNEEGELVVKATTGAIPINFRLRPPAMYPELPVRIDPRDGLWLNPKASTEINWLGRSRRIHHLASRGQFWLRPNVPPGRHELRLTVRASPAGRDHADRWPRIEISRPASNETTELVCDSRFRRTLSHVFDWQGPEDFLRLELANPTRETSGRPAFPLYFDDYSTGRRGVEFHRIEVFTLERGESSQ